MSTIIQGRYGQGLQRWATAAVLLGLVAGGCTGKAREEKKAGANPAGATASAGQSGQSGQPGWSGSSGSSGESRTPQPRDVNLPAGTILVGTLQNTVSSAGGAGVPVELRTVAPASAGGQVVVPAGATIHGQVTFAKSAGRLGGRSQLTIRFNDLVLPGGDRTPISCEPLRFAGRSKTSSTVEEIGGGAVGGAILGGILGGGKGALEGGAIGGAVGTGVAVATKGKQIVLPAGTRLRATLAAPVTLRVKPLA